MGLHLLMVDDDADVRSTLVDLLLEAGFTVTSADNGIAMREVFAGKRSGVDGVVLDWGMPGDPSTGLALHAQSLGLPVVMISGSIEATELRTRTDCKCFPSRSEWSSCWTR